MKRVVALAIALSLLPAARVQAYSVLTHEAIVDAVWDGSIAPLLRTRYHSTAAQLREARAYAYGGSIIQDIGYYPRFGDLFGDTGISALSVTGDRGVAALSTWRAPVGMPTSWALLRCRYRMSSSLM